MKYTKLKGFTKLIWVDETGSFYNKRSHHAKISEKLTIRSSNDSENCY